jgi:pimeloyl-ACP methyl ester carboxylesterase
MSSSALARLACALLAAAMAPAACSRPSAALHACDIPGVAGGGRCGTVEVYENRATRTGRRIALNVVVLPALESPARADPIVWLEGGPGGAATAAIGPVSRQYLPRLRRQSDLVFVDQRGTGASNPLQCDIGEDPANPDVFFGPIFPPSLIRKCREALSARADLALYTTPIAMDDLDEVRGALGYRSINLVGASYGTMAALAYIRQHPEHVRAAFLAGVAPPDFRLPLPFARAAQHALDGAFADCAAEPACRDAFPGLRREWSAVLARFDTGPLRVTMIDPATKRPRPIALFRESFVEHIRLLLYSTFSARFVPLVIHRASEGDFLPFQTMAARFNPGGSLARGMYFSVTCSEAIPFIEEREIVSETRDTFVGDRRIRAHVAACHEWVRGSVPREYAAPVRSGVPVVLFSGEADGATPPWIAASAVRLLDHGRQIVAPHTGHQIDSPCTTDLMQTFIANPSARQLDAACAATAHRPPFATAMPPV